MTPGATVSTADILVGSGAVLKDGQVMSPANTAVAVAIWPQRPIFKCAEKKSFAAAARALPDDAMSGVAALS